MSLLTQSALLQALGWSLFNSLWQMGLLWLFYWIVVAIFRNISAHSRHNLATALVGIGAIGAAVEFMVAYWFAGPSGVSMGWPGGGLLAGPGFFWQAARVAIREILPYCSSLYLLVLGVLLVRYSNHNEKKRTKGEKRKEKEKKN